jgi:hypothetical protein
VLAAARAEAQCEVDTDCPNAACGGDVCTKSSGQATCNAANTQGESGRNDGWCADDQGVADDSKCKCRGMGATCNGLYCTFTVPPTGTGGSGAAGSTGTGGGGTAGAAGGSGGTTSSGGGGCSVAGAPALGGAAGLCLMLAALVRGRARRRG